MKKLAVAGLVLAASVAFAPVALAQAPSQEPNAGCGAALLTLARAEQAAADASAADTAAEQAKKDDDAAADAAAAVDEARAAAVNGGVPSGNLTSADAQRLRQEKAQIEAVPQAERTPEQVDRLIEINRKLPLIEAFLAEQSVSVGAKAEADKTDADALRREADQTDAAALAGAAKQAEAAADKACGNGAAADVRFQNCDEVRAAGKAPLPSGDRDYRVGLDADRDGLACEDNEAAKAPSVKVPVPSEINTGRP